MSDWILDAIRARIDQHKERTAMNDRLTSELYIQQGVSESLQAILKQARAIAPNATLDQRLAYAKAVAAQLGENLGRAI